LDEGYAVACFVRRFRLDVLAGRALGSRRLTTEFPG
jgi:hypothetical protein